jgi:hypothetical protein
MLRRDDTGEVDLDFVGRVERLEEDFRVVAARVGAPEAQLVRRNGSRSSTEARERFSDRDREHLAALYRDDLEHFGYSADVAD